MSLSPSQILYTPEQRAKRDATRWTLVQGVLAPVQFLIFLASLYLVVHSLNTGVLTDWALIVASPTESAKTPRTTARTGKYVGVICFIIRTFLLDILQKTSGYSHNIGRIVLFCGTIHGYKLE